MKKIEAYDRKIVRNNKEDVKNKIIGEHRAVDNKFIKLVKCYNCKSIYYRETKIEGTATETICDYCEKLAVHYVYKDDTVILSRAELIHRINGLKAIIGRHTGETTRYKLKQRRLKQEILKLKQENLELRRKLIRR